MLCFSWLPQEGKLSQWNCQIELQCSLSVLDLTLPPLEWQTGGQCKLNSKHEPASIEQHFTAICSYLSQYRCTREASGRHTSSFICDISHLLVYFRAILDRLLYWRRVNNYTSIISVFHASFVAFHRTYDLKPLGNPYKSTLFKKYFISSYKIYFHNRFSTEAGRDMKSYIALTEKMRVGMKYTNQFDS